MLCPSDENVRTFPTLLQSETESLGPSSELTPPQSSNQPAGRGSFLSFIASRLFAFRNKRRNADVGGAESNEFLVRSDLITFFGSHHGADGSLLASFTSRHFLCPVTCADKLSLGDRSLDYLLAIVLCCASP